MFKALGILVIIGFIVVLWYLVNVFSKPILNRMHNYYEDDPKGRNIANMVIGVMLALAFLMGTIIT